MTVTQFYPGGGVGTQSYQQTPGGPAPLPTSEPPWDINPSAWLNDAEMFGRWITGTGPSVLHFGPGSVATQQMEQSPGVAAAMAFFRKKNAGVHCCRQLRPVRHYDYEFGPLNVPTANATEQFVGRYRVNIIPVGGDLLRVTVWNKTSMTSFAYHMLPSWNRGTFGPGGNMVETFT